MLGYFVIIMFIVMLGQFIYAYKFYKIVINFFERGNEKKLLLMIGLAILSVFFLSILYSYLVGYTYFFIIFFFASTLLAIVFWFFLAFGKRARSAIVSSRKTNSIKSIILYFVIACLVFPGSYILPFYGSRLYNSGCDAIHREIGNRITSAIQHYRSENGKYPEELDQLVPAYIPYIPTAVCFPTIRYFGISPQRYYFLRSNHDYKIVSCSQETFLVIEDMDHTYPQVMNLKLGTWSQPLFDTLDSSIEYVLCGP